MHLSRGEYEAFASYNRDRKQQSVFFFFLFVAESCIHLGFSNSNKATVGGERDGTQSAAVGEPKAPSVLHSEDGCGPAVPSFAWLHGWEAADPSLPTYFTGDVRASPHTPCTEQHTGGKEHWGTSMYGSGELGINTKTRNEHANKKGVCSLLSSGLCRGNVWDRNCPAGSSLGTSLTSIL